jgi:23S rRNA (cytosine1962-C5)-methyltransferase
VGALKTAILRPNRERSLLQRHPWVFAGAIRAIRGEPLPGETVDVVSSSGGFLARGAYSPSSQIAVRVWTWDEAEEVSSDFFAARLRRALAARDDGSPGAAPPGPNAVRLVNAESDGLPGLIVDRYAGYVVCQFLSAGAEHWKETIVGILAAGHCGLRGGFERSDVDVREKEGLPPFVGPLFGEEPPELIEVAEHGLRYLVDVRRGHKTGFYLDQRENRRIVGGLAAGKEVLNAFAYTGGFGLAALRGGAARVVNIDSSAAALELGGRNAALNGFPPAVCEQVRADAFTELRHFRDARRAFDLIVLDPPKLAYSAAQLERAGRAYKDINLLALKLLRPGGLLVTFSCSGVVSADLFQKIVHGAALDAARPAQIVGRLCQAPDHPVLLSFPEGEYLKGLILRVD